MPHGNFKYEIGQQLRWVPDSRVEQPTDVTVVELRNRGFAKLSNGWFVDGYGFAEGTRLRAGGKVQEVPPM